MEKVFAVAISQVVTRLVNGWEAANRSQAGTPLPITRYDLPTTPPPQQTWWHPLYEVIVHGASNGGR